jgi:hypothetical protein
LYRFLIEDSYTLTLLETKRSFVQQLLEEIHNGTLTQIREKQQIWKVTHPELALLGGEEVRQQENRGDVVQQL